MDLGRPLLRSNQVGEETTAKYLTGLKDDDPHTCLPNLARFGLSDDGYQARLGRSTELIVLLTNRRRPSYLVVHRR